MPRYFFDIDDGHRICRDLHGIELPHGSAVQQETKKLLFDLFYGVPATGRTIVACVVKDEAGRFVYRVMMTVDGEAATAPDYRRPA